MGFLSSITNSLKKATSDIKLWLQDFFSKENVQNTRETERVVIKYSGEFVEELPLENEIEENVIYVVGENGYEWLAAFVCPCGCNDLIQLNLLEDIKPGWRISKRNTQKISISPSIDRRVGCRSHFTVTNGEVRWWRDQSN